MKSKLNHLIYILNQELGLFLSISFSIFLFVLFFEPFPLERFDFNDRLIFVAGLGAIIFLFVFLVHVVFAWIVEKNDHDSNELAPPSYLGSFILFSLSTLAFTFYLHFVGWVVLSFYIMIRVVIVCLVPVVVLRLYDALKDLRHQNEFLTIEKRLFQKQVERYEDDYLKKSIELVAENTTDKVRFLTSDVAFVKSADNYVEIVYKEGEIFKKKLIRNTLKNVEQQLSSHFNFIRCHRICIVNSHFIEKLNRDNHHQWLLIRGFNEQIPVSRQYLVKLKEIV